MFNILTEPLIRMDTATSSGMPATVPEVYEALMADKVDAFPALRPHQRHAWHAFLVQLGAMALHRAGRSAPPAAAEEWRDLIRGLTPDYPDDEPWQLVVEDITKPAFMQPPASSKERRVDYDETPTKKNVVTPDEMDILGTSKNHDLKRIVATEGSENDWLFALITLQTMSAQDGRGNYYVSRIKSAYSSRPALSLTPSERTGVHVFRDMMVLLANLVTEGEASLLWTMTWDGEKKEALLPDQLLRPFYIEICRRIRLQVDEDGNLYGIRAKSNGARIKAKALRGRMSDPWTPVNKDEGEALNVGPVGFTYKRITDYLTLAAWEWPTLLLPTLAERRSGRPLFLVARSLKRNTRKQGMTEGYHERIIPLRPKVIAAFGRAGPPKALGDIAQQRIEQIGIVQRILRHAIATFAARGDSNRREHRNANPSPNERTRIWIDKLDDIVDRDFFHHLQTEFEASESERSGARKKWLMNGKDGVVDYARQILRAAEDSLPCPAIQRFKARVCAENVFEGRRYGIRGRDGLPFLFNDAEKDDKE